MQEIASGRRALLAAAWVLAFLVPRIAAAAGSTALERLHQRLLSAEIPGVHSVLIEQRDTSIAQWYFQGTDEQRGSAPATVKFGPDTLHDLRSVTKSVVSLLFGMAMHEGAIKSLDTPVLDYFPEYRDLQTPERRRIRLRDILTMTSGLHWDESLSYRDPRNSETAMDMAPDRYRYVLSSPIDSPPGVRWRYSGGDVALVAAVIARATGMSLDEYAKGLFSALGITRFTWYKDARGVPIAASGLRLTPPEMLQIGQLVMHGGRDSAGHQIIPESWIAEATQPHAKAYDGRRCTVEYGYLWWLGPRCPRPWIAAIGNGGQRIFLVPDRHLLVVTTAGLYNSRSQNEVDDIVSSIEDALAEPPAAGAAGSH